MGNIHILDEVVSNMIAAGEVVENPSAMIKELIENSLDAKAKNIKIDVKNSGRYVKIVDDGVGMDEQDIFLSIERHATSKIQNQNDVFNIKTYGFRGEALASISSVSKFVLSSQTKDSDIGDKIYVDGGDIKKTEKFSQNVGTQIEIKDLFYNTPARLKFLRKKTTEYDGIKNIVIKEALANFHVKFSLFIDQKEILKTTGRDLENTIIELFGIGIFQKLIKFEYGYISKLELTKSYKSNMFTYVNNRTVKSILLEKAIINGYYTNLMKGKYPFVILFLNLLAKNIDVNIHPSKKIIKFYDRDLVYKEVSKKIKDAIDSNYKEITPKIDDLKIFENEKFNLSKTKLVDEFDSKDNFNFSENTESSNGNLINNNREESSLSYLNESQSNYTNKLSTPQKEYVFSQPEFQEKNYSSLKILGQVHKMYIVVNGDKGIEIYDQHATHERILYEKFKSKYSENKFSKKLLIPEKIKLDYVTIKIIQENIEKFNDAGFSIEDFGDKDVIITAIPDFSINTNVSELFFEILDGLKNKNIVDIKEKTIISISCKAAIKAGEVLDKIEMEKLIRGINSIKKYTCPHGRPIILKLNFNDLEKMFKRK